MAHLANHLYSDHLYLSSSYQGQTFSLTPTAQPAPSLEPKCQISILSLLWKCIALPSWKYFLDNIWNLFQVFAFLGRLSNQQQCLFQMISWNTNILGLNHSLLCVHTVCALCAYFPHNSVTHSYIPPGGDQDFQYFDSLKNSRHVTLQRVWEETADPSWIWVLCRLWLTFRTRRLCSLLPRYWCEIGKLNGWEKTVISQHNTLNSFQWWHTVVTFCVGSWRQRYNIS